MKRCLAGDKDYFVYVRVQRYEKMPKSVDNTALLRL